MGTSNDNHNDNIANCQLENGDIRLLDSLWGVGVGARTVLAQATHPSSATSPFNSSHHVGLDLRSSDPMPRRLAHAPGHSDDTEAHTNTRRGAAHAGGAGTCTTPDDPVSANAAGIVGQ